MASVARSRSKRTAPAQPRLARGKSCRATRLVGWRQGFIGSAPGLGVATFPHPPGLQTKLKISAPNDKFEQEADRLADQVIRMADPQRTGSIDLAGEVAPDGIQGMCAECEEEVRRQAIEDEEEELQMKRASGATPEIGPGLQTQISGLRGGGQLLSPSLRAFFEPRFGHDFSRVRIHTDAQNTRAVHALAFTVGRDVVFGAGQYAPETRAGKRLLAHELAHVVQQGESTCGAQQVQRQTPEWGHPCPIYDGYDTARSVAGYNCLGLALRTYDYKGLSEAENAIVDRFPLGVSIGCSQSCDPGQIKIWYWEFSQRVEDEDGRRSGLRDQFGVPVPSESWRDYHMVAGAVDSLGGDPQDVYSKNGQRPVDGPSTGPTFRLPDREHATMNRPSAMPLYALDTGKPLYFVRSDHLDKCYCGSPCPST